MKNKILNYRVFFCSVCLRPSLGYVSETPRESFNCLLCGATSRDRAVALGVYLLRCKLKKFKLFTKLNIVGISDGFVLEKHFSNFFIDNYTNYHFHKSPFVDITKLPPEIENTANIIICSEVLEHVKPPIEAAFSGLANLLATDGGLVISVPHTSIYEQHVEHFPILVNDEITTGDEKTLRGIDLHGNTRIFRDLVFHGGDGSTLEYRIFSQLSLFEYLNDVGFCKIEQIRNNCLFGVKWNELSRVWIVTK